MPLGLPSPGGLCTLQCCVLTGQSWWPCEASTFQCSFQMARGPGQRPRRVWGPVVCLSCVSGTEVALRSPEQTLAQCLLWAPQSPCITGVGIPPGNPSPLSSFCPACFPRPLRAMLQQRDLLACIVCSQACRLAVFPFML